jgi:hypothetical protein
MSGKASGAPRGCNLVEGVFRLRDDDPPDRLASFVRALEYGVVSADLEPSATLGRKPAAR